MGKIRIGTTFVLEDEPCLGLSEVNLMCPEDGLWHRYQLLLVVREDKLAEHKIDLGLTKDFKSQQVLIPGTIEETVGRLREVADHLREQTDFWEIAKRN